MAFIATVQKIVSGADMFIYAPPAYGKTAYQLNSKYQAEMSVMDVEGFRDIDPPNDSHFEVIISSVHTLMRDKQFMLCIVFLPPRGPNRNPHVRQPNRHCRDDAATRKGR